MAPTIAVSTRARTMPPMPVNNDGSCNTYKNARWLSEEEIDLIGRWADAGAPLGDPANAPPPPGKGVELSGEIKSFDIGVDYTVHPPPGSLDEYRCFVMDPGLTEEVFVTGFDIKPTNAQVVHHIALHVLPDADAEAAAIAKDAEDEEPGYPCFGGPEVIKAMLIGPWVPGTGPTLFPAGSGNRVPPGRKMVAQIHYNVPPTGGPFVDRSSVQLATVKSVAEEAWFIAVGTPGLSLAPRQEYVEATGEIPLSMFNASSVLPPSVKRVRTWGSLPHEHKLGRTMQVYAKGLSSESCLMDVDRWNFHWQALWWYDTPVDIGLDDLMKVTCGYDTRERTETVNWGERTEDEMCVNVMYVTAIE